MDEKEDVFQSETLLRIRTLILGLFTAAILGTAASGFVQAGAAAAIGALLCIVVIYLALVIEDIKIIVDSRTFTMYRRDKVVHRFILDDIYVIANRKRDGAIKSCLLSIISEDHKITQIDCSILGKKQFARLLASLDDVIAKSG